MLDSSTSSREDLSPVRKRAFSLLITSAAAAIALGVGTTAAMAATTWSVSPGGSATAKSGKTTLEDTSTKTVLTCTSSSSSITLKKGHGLPGAKIGTITKLSFTGCTGPLGLTFTVTVNNLPYYLNAVSYSSSTGTTKGTITGIDAKLSGPDCSAVVDGTGAGKHNGEVTGTYSNSKHTLTVSGGNLHIYSVSGCLGLIKSGDAASYKATYTVSPAQKITSP
jgi:hypothetical protein